MGTPLANGVNAPYGTREGLIKTTDNAALSATIKNIGDGAGNDSGMWLGINKVGFNEAVVMTATSTQLNSTVAKVAYITVTQNVDLDAIETNSNASKVKTDLITITGAVNLDTINSNYLSTSTAASTYQPLSGNLTIYAGIAPSANVQTLLGAANYAAFKTSLSLNSVENTALSTWTGSSNITTLGTIGTGIWSGTTIAVTKGGTGLTALGTGLQVLRTNAGATAMEWATISAGGGDLLATNNLSDLTNAATARTNLGLAIGTNVQAYSANLTTYAGIAPSANVQTLLGAANYAAFRTSLGVAIGSDVQAYNASLAAIAAGTWTGASSITTTGALASGSLASGYVIGGVTMTLGSDGTGDIYYRNSGGVLTRLAAGTNGHVLTLSGGLPSWAAASGGGGSGDMVSATYDPATIAEQLVGLTATQTLSNKTLTAPKIVSGGFIADANGNEILEFETTASAVNHLKIVNDIVNGDPYIEVAGSDTNVGMFIVAKGNGFFALDSTTSTTGTARGIYAVDLQIYRTSSAHAATGPYSFAANGQNTAGGSFAAAFGNSTTASAQTSMAIGQNTTASGQESFAGGFRTRAALRGSFSWSGGMHSTGGNTGDNQFTLLCARRYITGATTGQTGITLYIGDGTSTEIVPDVTSLTYRTWTVMVRWNVVISATSGTTTGLAAANTVGGQDIIILKKTGSTVTVVETSLGTIFGDTNMKTGISMGYTASGTNFRINLVAPTFTGGGSLTLKAHADLFIAENGY